LLLHDAVLIVKIIKYGNRYDIVIVSKES